MEELRADAARDLRDAAGWFVFGSAVLIGSIAMDRLESQSINPYTVPGLLPGLLGLAAMLLAVLLALRSWRRGALHAPAGPAIDRAVARRLALIIALVVAYAIGLVGHGMPFWLASALYVAVAIVTLQAPQRAALGTTLTLREVAFAIAVGVGSGVVVTYVFQDLFLVRLP